MVLTDVKPRLSLFTEARFILRHYSVLILELQVTVSPLIRINVTVEKNLTDICYQPITILN